MNLYEVLRDLDGSSREDLEAAINARVPRARGLLDAPGGWTLHQWVTVLLQLVATALAAYAVKVRTASPPPNPPIEVTITINVEDPALDLRLELTRILRNLLAEPPLNR